MRETKIPLIWKPRPIPLSPEGALGRGPVATRLARRVMRLPPDTFEALTGAAGPELLVIFAPADQLPWVDGIEYLGRVSEAPQVYLPTHRGFDVAPSLVTRAIHHAGMQGPLALVERPPALLDLSAVGRLDRNRLTAWLETAP